jgi:DNA repair protein RecO (recombination protein O)
MSETGFVLHSLPHRETSLIVELFSLRHGRLAVMAKGARRPQSALRAVLLQFQPIEFTLAGKGELRLLTRAEWQGGLPMP